MSDNSALIAENKQLRTDIEHLLSILDFHVEATGEGLDQDDACMVAQIRASPGRTGTDAAMMAGFDLLNSENS
jgi:tRNA A37 threonylcarbamoyltransferase TsaD